MRGRSGHLERGRSREQGLEDDHARASFQLVGREKRLSMTRAVHEALRTPLCDLLGIRYPICQAGMGWVARSSLAAAVSAAGGLGVIAAAHGSPQHLREEIRRVRDQTDQPFGVDVLFATIRAAGDEVEQFTDQVKGWIDVTLEERVPVLVAGLGNPGPVAALALSAVGVWMGTRFIATHEAFGHDNYKKKIVAIEEEGTVVHRGATGKPCRAIRNEFTREWEKRTAEILPFPLQAQRVGFPAAIRAREEGDVDHGHAACGQSAGLIEDIVAAREVIERLVAEAHEGLARMSPRA